MAILEGAMTTPLSARLSSFGMKSIQCGGIGMFSASSACSSVRHGHVDVTRF
jgi:hypothetical protein